MITKNQTEERGGVGYAAAGGGLALRPEVAAAVVGRARTPRRRPRPVAVRARRGGCTDGVWVVSPPPVVGAAEAADPRSSAPESLSSPAEGGTSGVGVNTLITTGADEVGVGVPFSAPAPAAETADTRGSAGFADSRDRLPAADDLPPREPPVACGGSGGGVADDGRD